jgi:hypothetical protein
MIVMIAESLGGTCPPTPPLRSHVGERGRLSWATAERTQSRPGSTHPVPPAGQHPPRISGERFPATRRLLST